MSAASVVAIAFAAGGLLGAGYMIGLDHVRTRRGALTLTLAFLSLWIVVGSVLLPRLIGGVS